MRGEGRDWQGRFDLAEAASLRDENGDLQVSVSIEGRLLDADPASVALIRPPADWRSGAYWDGLEAQRGGQTTATGGPDLWHRLGEAPALSFLIILDGSGSMGEQGRMEFARDGITQSFANLPEDEVIEYAAVAFSGCSGFTTRQFTRDADSIREFLVSVSPYDSTPLAAAHDVARGMFTHGADPRAQAWRYASFTDGAETCDGNVTSAIRDLEAVLARHEAPDSAPLPETEVADAPRPAVNCRADSWSGYAVDVRDGGRHLDRITLVEHSFSERALPDGRCLNIYEVKDYGVYYGRTQTSGWRWGINSRPSETRTEVGSATQGQASLDRVRNLAGAARNGLTDLPTARRRVGEAVSNADPEQG
nr:VWA domain-containing protein [Maricaulis parjimensis]